MSFDLEPVWPWTRLYDLLMLPPASVRFLALFAALASAAAVVTAFARARLLTWALVGSVALALLFVGRHLWSPAMADAEAAAGAGVFGFLVGAAWLLGLFLLLLAPFVLAGLSVAAYVGTRNVSRRKLATVVGLRLLAFLLALTAVARPAFTWADSESRRSVLYVLIDRSRSMTIPDEPVVSTGKTAKEDDRRSRWEQVRRCLDDSAVVLARLDEEHQIDVRFFSFDTQLRPFDPAAPGKADGTRSDYAAGLRRLFDQREASVPVRAVLLVGDGGDNVNPRTAVEQQAARWRGVPCLVHTFACGSPMTSKKQDDVALTTISTSPSPFVPIKGKLTVKVTIDARGFENRPRDVRLLLEGEDGKDQEAARLDQVILPLTVGNEVTLSTEAPAKAGEYKVRVEVDRPQEDKQEENNVIETFVTVSKEGVSVLLADRLRAGEPQAICDVLVEDPRVRVTPLWLAGGKPLPGSDVNRIFDKDEAPFDVIILGDVSLEVLRAAHPRAPERIAELVRRGTGLIVLGGLTNLGNGGWKGSALEPLLPVDLSMADQIEDKDGKPLPLPMVPTGDGLKDMRYLFALDSRKKDEEVLATWRKLSKDRDRDRWLRGATRLKPQGPAAKVLARSEEDDGKGIQQGEPLLIKGEVALDGKGPKGVTARVLVFGGDTTHRWVRSDETRQFFSRFWRQIVVWLAKQEDAEGQVWVRPDGRRIPAKSELGFLVGMRARGGGPEVRDGKFDVKVVTPEGKKIDTPPARGETENRGSFTSTQAAGVYRVVVRGEGKDPSTGAPIEGEASARVIVYDENVEMSRPAADHDFLAKLAAASGGGESRRIEELPDFLAKLAERPQERGRESMKRRPNWGTTERSPFLLAFFVAFCVVVSLEWGLRRWWGLK